MMKEGRLKFADAWITAMHWKGLGGRGRLPESLFESVRSQWSGAMQLKDKTSVVAGAVSGIGREIARTAGSRWISRAMRSA
jgi:hypothetical protein